MTSYSSEIQAILPFLPPLIAFLTIFFQRDIGIRDLRSSYFLRKRVLYMVAHYNKNFRIFLKIFMPKEEPRKYDFIKVLPGILILILTLYVVLKYSPSLPDLFYIMAFILVLLLFPLSVLSNSFRPRFIKKELPNVQRDTNDTGGKDTPEGEEWSLDTKPKVVFNLILGLYVVPYSISSILFIATFFIVIFYITIPNYIPLSVLISASVVSASSVVVLMAFRSGFANFRAKLENRAFQEFKKHTEYATDPTIRVYVTFFRGSIMEIEGRLKNIGNKLEIEDKEGFIHLIEWRAIYSIGIKQD